MLDPDIAEILGQPAPMTALTREMMPMIRAGMAATAQAFPTVELPRVENFDADGVPVRLYVPEDAAKLPLLVFLHGGGWMLGDLETHDAMLRHLAVHSNCAVLGVGYRLAPEHPFPAGFDDCMAAFIWARRMAGDLGCDADRVALGGESAGANLAAALTIKLREEGLPQPLFQLLIHPATDFRFELPSLTSVSAPGLSREYMESCRDLYLGATDVSNPLVSPLQANSHAGLAPAIVLTASEDPLRDDGEYYARALSEAGVETLVQRLQGLPHGFQFLPITIPVVLDANRLIGRLIRRYFTNP